MTKEATVKHRIYVLIGVALILLIHSNGLLAQEEKWEVSVGGNWMIFSDDIQDPYRESASYGSSLGGQIGVRYTWKVIHDKWVQYPKNIAFYMSYNHSSITTEWIGLALHDYANGMSKELNLNLQSDVLRIPIDAISMSLDFGILVGYSLDENTAGLYYTTNGPYSHGGDFDRDSDFLTDWRLGPTFAIQFYVPGRHHLIIPRIQLFGNYNPANEIGAIDILEGELSASLGIRF